MKVNRIRDASGKPKGFAFVEYGDAESVLRCLEVVNGVSLVGRDGESKNLMVKADAKVRERLDAHEASRMKSSVCTFSSTSSFLPLTLESTATG